MTTKTKTRREKEVRKLMKQIRALLREGEAAHIEKGFESFCVIIDFD